MLPREVVIAEIARSHIEPGHVENAIGGWRGRDDQRHRNRDMREMPRQDRIYGWIERAQAEGVHFPLDAYNTRIPQEFIEEVTRREAVDADLPAPWSEQFRPATEDDILALLSGTE
jgi:hypothetical protein